MTHGHNCVVAGAFVFTARELLFERVILRRAGCLVAHHRSDSAGIKNLARVVEARRSLLDKVVRRTVLLRNMDNFGTVNSVHSNSLRQIPSLGRSFKASPLATGSLIEIEAIAAK